MPRDTQDEYREVLNDVLRGRYQGDDAARRLERARMAVSRERVISAPDHAMRSRGYAEQMQREARERAQAIELQRQQMEQAELARRMFAPNPDVSRIQGLRYEGMILDEVLPGTPTNPNAVVGALNYANAAARNAADRQREREIARQMQQMMDQMMRYNARMPDPSDLLSAAAEAVNRQQREEFFDIEGTDDAPQT